jgi:hypothetical protein
LVHVCNFSYLKGRDGRGCGFETSPLKKLARPNPINHNGWDGMRLSSELWRRPKVGRSWTEVEPGQTSKTILKQKWLEVWLKWERDFLIKLMALNSNPSMYNFFCITMGFHSVLFISINGVLKSLPNYRLHVFSKIITGEAETPNNHNFKFRHFILGDFAKYPKSFISNFRSFCT